MDDIHNDVIIDKMAGLVWGLYHAVFKMNFVCSFLHLGPRDNKGKKQYTYLSDINRRGDLIYTYTLFHNMLNMHG